MAVTKRSIAGSENKASAGPRLIHQTRTPPLSGRCMAEGLSSMVPAGETRVLKYLQERMPYELFVPDVP